MPARVQAGSTGADGAPPVPEVGEASRKAFLKGEGGGVEPQDGTILHLSKEESVTISSEVAAALGEA